MLRASEELDTVPAAKKQACYMSGAVKSGFKSLSVGIKSSKFLLFFYTASKEPKFPNRAEQTAPGTREQETSLLLVF